VRQVRAARACAARADGLACGGGTTAGWGKEGRRRPESGGGVWVRLWGGNDGREREGASAARADGLASRAAPLPRPPPSTCPPPIPRTCIFLKVSAPRAAAPRAAAESDDGEPGRADWVQTSCSNCCCGPASAVARRGRAQHSRRRAVRVRAWPSDVCVCVRARVCGCRVRVYCPAARGRREAARRTGDGGPRCLGSGRARSSRPRQLIRPSGGEGSRSVGPGPGEWPPRARHGCHTTGPESARTPPGSIRPAPPGPIRCQGRAAAVRAEAAGL
jgi:hypothetical protein